MLQGSADTVHMVPFCLILLVAYLECSSGLVSYYIYMFYSINICFVSLIGLSVSIGTILIYHSTNFSITFRTIIRGRFYSN